MRTPFMMLDTGLLVTLVVIGVIVLVAVILISWWIGTMNRMRRMQISVDESLSDIDVALTKRFDLLTKEMAATKGYLAHEKETLSLVTKLRSGLSSAPTPSSQGSARTVAEVQNFAAGLDQLARSVNLTFEQYPDLKADGNVKYLQAAITDVEEHLQASRRLYNSNVSSYNKYIIVFPNSLVSHAIKAEPRLFFETEEPKRQDVKIDL